MKILTKNPSAGQDVKITSVRHDSEMALPRAEYDKIKLLEPYTLAEDNGLVDLRKVLIPDGSGKVQTFTLPESFLERFKYGIMANYCDHTIISHAFLHNGMELTAHVMLQKDYVFQLEDTGLMFFYKGQLNLRDLVLGMKQGSFLPIADFDEENPVNPSTTEDDDAGSNEAAVANPSEAAAAAG